MLAALTKHIFGNLTPLPLEAIDDPEGWQPSIAQPEAVPPVDSEADDFDACWIAEICSGTAPANHNDAYRDDLVNEIMRRQIEPTPKRHWSSPKVFDFQE